MKTGTTRYAGFVSPTCFPRAAEYTGLGVPESFLLRERKKYPHLPDFSERHLQCVWYDSDWRPGRLQTSSGEQITVEDPGIWNLEAGPDFLGAALRIGPENRRVKGDVEIHIHPSDWKHHGHADDPRYRKVRVHVTYFPGEPDPALFPPGTLHIALKDALLLNPRFSFESLDITAYPLAARAKEPPCRKALAGWTPGERASLLSSAGEERLRRKAERMASAIREKGAEQVFYEEIMSALGYKNNKAPFRRLAENVPFKQLAGLDTLSGYALLLGVAGLLPKTLDKLWDQETQDFVRSVWDYWWKHKDPWEKRVLSSQEWQLGGVRPVNAPARRLMAAAHLFTMEKPLLAQIQELLRDDPASALEETSELLQVDGGLYWHRRISLSGGVTKEPVALIGHSRTVAILLNVILPFAAAEGIPTAPLLEHLPAEATNSIVRQTALTLFGQDQSPALYRHGLRQQGLTQIFHDFCLNDRSRCEQCALPALLHHAGAKAS